MNDKQEWVDRVFSDEAVRGGLVAVWLMQLQERPGVDFLGETTMTPLVTNGTSSGLFVVVALVPLIGESPKAGWMGNINGVGAEPDTH